MGGRKQPGQKDSQEQRQKTRRVSGNQATYVEPAGYAPRGDQAIAPPEAGEENRAHQARQSPKGREDAEQQASDPLGIANGDAVEPQHGHVEEGQAQAGRKDSLPAVRFPALTACAQQPSRVLKAERKSRGCGLLSFKVRSVVLWLIQSFGLVEESISGFQRASFPFISWFLVNPITN